MPARAIIIGLDGADPGLLDRWCANGSLPNIARLRAAAACGAIATPVGLGDDAVWPSFYLGTTVGDHGRYFWAQLKPGTDRISLSRDLTFPGTPFWSRLSDAGRRVAVIDVPKCPVATDLNGIHLCDWLVHGRDYKEPVGWPRDVAVDVADAFGKAPPSICSEFVRELDETAVATVRNALLTSCAMKRRASLHVLDKEDWDVFVTVFKEAHCATHLLWHLVDPGHPAHRPGQDDDMGKPLKAVYVALDAAVGALLAAAGDQSAILLFTPIGMAANFTGEHLIDGIVAAINDRRAGLAGGILRTLWGALKRRDAVFALPHNEASSAIRIRVRGRDPWGRIHPGAEYRALCDALSEELRQLADPVTGRRIVADVIKSQERFPGPRSDSLPDLFVLWDRSAPIDGAGSRLSGTIAGHPPTDRRSGNHRPGGAYIVAGAAREPWRDTSPVDISNLAGRFLSAAGMPLEGMPASAPSPR